MLEHGFEIGPAEHHLFQHLLNRMARQRLRERGEVDDAAIGIHATEALCIETDQLHGVSP